MIMALGFVCGPLIIAGLVMMVGGLVASSVLYSSAGATLLVGGLLMMGLAMLLADVQKIRAALGKTEQEPPAPAADLPQADQPQG